MCPWCKIAQDILGRIYSCRICWRRQYRNKKPTKTGFNTRKRKR